tara:strand:- start:22 stop:174 length:153 start_codon:yes stop_codon:yes gene_type:complete
LYSKDETHFGKNKFDIEFGTNIHKAEIKINKYNFPKSAVPNSYAIDHLSI